MFINDTATLRLGRFLRDELQSEVALTCSQNKAIPGSEYDLHDSVLTRAIEAVIVRTIHVFCDEETSAHTLRLARIVEVVGEALKLPGQEICRLRIAALLHDIGKVAISPIVLHKPGNLDEAERDIIRQHVFIGQQMLYEAGGIFVTFAPIVVAHHEAWNGCGYPFGLKGQDIPLLARILAIADAYDAMVSTRIYREPRPILHVCRELMQCAGHQFDPRIVHAFLCLLSSQQAQLICFLPFKQTPSASELAQVDEEFSALLLQSAEFVRV